MKGGIFRPGRKSGSGANGLDIRHVKGRAVFRECHISRVGFRGNKSGNHAFSSRSAAGSPSAQPDHRECIVHAVGHVKGRAIARNCQSIGGIPHKFTFLTQQNHRDGFRHTVRFRGNDRNIIAVAVRRINKFSIRTCGNIVRVQAHLNFGENLSGRGLQNGDTAVRDGSGKRIHNGRIPGRSGHKITRAGLHTAPIRHIEFSVRLHNSVRGHADGRRPDRPVPVVKIELHHLVVSVQDDVKGAAVNDHLVGNRR
ncbi:hypothetical protein BMS3Abin05_01504 [bacterium BMS3Abin05]|nr:hypothetical protein BMS3Abin05_01504 [bacterium BMS3Abin05]